MAEAYDGESEVGLFGGAGCEEGMANGGMSKCKRMGVGDRSQRLERFENLGLNYEAHSAGQGRLSGIRNARGPIPIMTKCCQ